MKKTHIPSLFRPYLLAFRSSPGFAIGPILFVIAMFAILATAIAVSSGNFTISVTDSSSRVLASALVQSGVDVQNAVEHIVSANGCSQQQLDFSNPITTFDYTNPNAPSNHMCTVFHQDGGESMMPSPPADAVDKSDANFPTYMFTGCLGVSGLGLAPNAGEGVETMMQLMVTHSVCKAVNDIVGVTTSDGEPPVFSNGDVNNAACQVTQNYATSNVLGLIGDPTSVLAGKQTGCYLGPTGHYFFYHVLLIQ